MLRLLFLHAGREKAVEYSVHQGLVDNADPSQLEASFIWQNTAGVAQPAQDYPEQQIFWHNFGRDLSIEPKPSRVSRALMMAAGYPGGLGLVAQMVRRQQPDFLYTSQNHYDLHLAELVSSFMGTRHLIHLHYPVGPWLGRGALATIRRSPRMLAVSEFIRQTAIQAGVAPEAVHTLHNSVDARQFQVAPERAAVRAEFGWDADAPLILSVGRLDPSKGHMLLLESFAHVRKIYPAARLLICGVSNTRDTYAETLQQRVVELGLEQQVVFAGKRADIPRLLASADVFSLPTVDDACPMVFLEAMAAGVPAVALRSGGVPEMVVDGKTGLLSDLDDSVALATNLARVLGDTDLRRSLAEAARVRVETIFSPKRIVARWQNILLNMHAGRMAPVAHTNGTDGELNAAQR